jgi:hypothetical protein
MEKVFKSFGFALDEPRNVHWMPVGEFPIQIVLWGLPKQGVRWFNHVFGLN